MDHFPTGRSFQAYLNPERDVPIESQRVHGLSDEFLADKPLFAAWWWRNFWPSSAMRRW